MGEKANDLTLRVEALKDMLVDCATGGTGSNDEYVALRSEFIKTPEIKDKLPRFVMSCRNLGEFWGFIKGKFAHYSERREFLREAFDPLLTMLEQSTAHPSDEATGDILSRVDSDHVRLAWRKALERRGTDSEGAVTAARTLLETVCKHILDAENVTYKDADDLPTLYGLVSKHLGMSPSQRADRSLKRMLGGCHTVVQGIAELRNTAGDAHGRGRCDSRIAGREAQFAVNLAGTAAAFLIGSWEATKHQTGS